MRILITGANGFIGASLVAYLLQQGHSITCCVRDVAATKGRFPSATVIACDFNTDITLADWLPRLVDIDAVINCAGVLIGSAKQNIANIHYHAPLALFNACEQLAIKRVLHISALGVEDGPELDYVTSKRALDRALAALKLSSCILRPSLIYASGAYGGTALLRALSALPFFIPLIGTGDSRFQPLAMFDLVRIVEHFLHNEQTGIINAVGPEAVSIKHILVHLRQWLGFKTVPTLSIPLSLIQCLAKLGDATGTEPLNSVSLRMTLHENIADPKPLQTLLPFTLSPFTQGLQYYPSQTQDRWQAKLYFLRPLLKISLVLLWLFSGIIPLLNPSNANHLLVSAGFTPAVVPWVRTLTCLWDIFLALGLLFAFKPKLMGILQLLTVISYTVAASFMLPYLWLDPLAPLLKNIPILLTIAVWLAIHDRR